MADEPELSINEWFKFNFFLKIFSNLFVTFDIVICFENITLIPPGGPIVSGTDNYRVFLGPVFDAATYKIKDKDYDIEIIGDIAIVRSRKTVYLTFKDNANTVASEGALQKNITTSDYLDVLKRQKDGSWKCLVHSWQDVDIGKE